VGKHPKASQLKKEIAKRRLGTNLVVFAQILNGVFLTIVQPSSKIFLEVLSNIGICNLGYKSREL